MFVPTTHIYAQIRDSAGNRMPVAARVELCMGAECLAVFKSLNSDMELLDCYGVFGSSFLVFPSSRRIDVLKKRFSYNLHEAVDDVDRFDIGNATFAELLRVLYWDHQEWYCTSITNELKSLIKHVGPQAALSPVQLNFITLDTSEPVSIRFY